MPDGEQRLIGGRYRVTRQLGKGGMGTVWLAEDIVLGRRVALKELLRLGDGGDQQRNRQRALREARVLARLDHPAIVKIHDVLWGADIPWIVMDYINGRSLANLMTKTQRLPPLDIARIGLRVLDALDAAHRETILHRDVKPGNILVRDDGAAFLVDFGLARIAGEPALTAASTVLGTVEYMAPERFNGDPGPASDLWSLGVTFFHALEGYSPFRPDDSCDIPTIMWTIMNRTAPRAERSGPFTEVIRRLLSRHPADRPSAAELRSVITPILDGRPPGGKAPDGKPTVRPASPRPQPPVHPPGPPRPSPDVPNGRPGQPAEFLTWLAAYPDAEVAQRLRALSPELGRDLLKEARPDRAGSVLLALPGDAAARILAATPPRTAAAFLEAMATEPRQTAEVLLMLSIGTASQAVSRMKAEVAALVVEAMPPGEAARILNQTALRATAGIIAVLSAETALGVIAATPTPRTCEVFTYVPPDMVATLLRMSHPARAESLMSGLHPSMRTQVLRHLRTDDRL